MNTHDSYLMHDLSCYRLLAVHLQIAETTMRSIVPFIFLFVISARTHSQCTGSINSFPYTEGFETDDGGWVSGGIGNDWAWGIPNKPVIAAAGGGSRCWIVGGLTGSSYTNAEASWIQSPCFDFTGLQYPYIEFKVNWESEQQFDGASFQYSLDNGSSWYNAGSITDPKNCLNDNWFNHSPVNFLSSFSASRDGWSGNIQPTAGSCRGGNGSNGWLLAKHTMSELAGEPGVLFRFVFGAGTQCNNYDGFAVDDIMIGEAPPNYAGFNYDCINSKTVSFTNTSALCPASFSWDFGDPASGSNNTATTANATHNFSGSGKYTISLTVSGPGNAPSTITKEITILEPVITMLTAVDCETNTGGSLLAQAGLPGVIYSYIWNTAPPQTGFIATGLAEGVYTVTISGDDACTATGTGKAEKDLSCIGIYFPAAFTPDKNGRNDGFGPLGSISSMTDFKLSIYNRWGERIFYSTNPLQKWDGLVRGSKTDGNVFAWQAEFVLAGQVKQFRKGTVLLIR